MNVNRVIEVEQKNPVRTLQEFLINWWQAYHLEALLAPVDISDHNLVGTRVIQDPAALAAVNPFAPVMVSDAARTGDRLCSGSSFPKSGRDPAAM